nr:hypothetical protein DBT41_12455 [Aerococcus urinae]
MTKTTKTVLIVFALLIGLAALPALYMTGCMEGMMSSRSGIMSGHMMDGGSQRPNEQWRE